MRAATFIILTSRKSAHIGPGDIDRAISFAESQKLEPILILGQDGDDIIGLVERLDDVQMVFDPNDQGNEFSGVKAGLHATETNSILWSSDTPLPNFEEIAHLQKALLDREENSPLPSAEHVDVFSSRKGLWLVTLRGVKTLRALGAQEKWLSSPHVVFAQW